jgi:hypothetical protein
VVLIAGMNGLDAPITYIEFCSKGCIIIHISLLYFCFNSSNKTEGKACIAKHQNAVVYVSSY